MSEYLLYFNQQWVGDHSEDWFRGRGPRAMAVVNEMKEAGVPVTVFGARETTHNKINADLGRPDDPTTKALDEFFARTLKK